MATERMHDVMNELKPVGERYRSGDFRGGLVLLQDLWLRLPAPKAATQNAYLIVEYGVTLALKADDLSEAWMWAHHAPDFKSARHDCGEVEFLIGRVAYADGKLDMAAEHFREAKRKSKGKVFHGEDPKYAALL